MQLGKIFKTLLLILIIIIFSLPLENKVQAATWSSVVTNGFGSTSNLLLTRLKEFNNKLYATTYNFSGPQLWSSTNGVSWTRETGFSPTTGFYSVLSLEEFGGYLYIAPELDACLGQVAELYRSSDGSNWTKVVSDGFGNSNNCSLDQLIAFNGNLYALTRNEVSGLQVYSSSNGTSWSRVAGNGLSGSVNNFTAYSMGVFNNKLYIGTDNPTTGTEIWSSSDGTNWTQVSTSGFGGGSGSDYTPTLVVFNNYLYALVQNTSGGGQIWRTSDGTNWTKVVNAGGPSKNNIRFAGAAVVNNIFYVGTRNSTNGAGVFSSTDGVNYTQEGTYGFGSAANFLIFDITLFNDYIYVGFGNTTTGVQIWRTQITPLSLTTTSLSAGKVGNQYSATLSSTSGTTPVTFSTTSGSMPPGVSVSTSGVVEGNPTQGGTYTFNLCATDSGVPAQVACNDFILVIYGPAGPPVCTAISPGPKAPHLYNAIAQSNRSIRLYWQEGDGPITKYVLEFGTSSKDYRFGSPYIGGPGTTSYLVKNLNPDTTYYFKIRGDNDCALGTWSNVISGSTGITPETPSETEKEKAGENKPQETPTPTQIKGNTHKSAALYIFLLISLLLIGYFFKLGRITRKNQK